MLEVGSLVSDGAKIKRPLTGRDSVERKGRLYDRLFAIAQSDTGDRDFLEELNADSLKTVAAFLEPSPADLPAGSRFQFERHGYFVTDLKDHAEGKAVFNRVTGMKDSWAK